MIWNLSFVAWSLLTLPPSSATIGRVSNTNPKISVIIPVYNASQYLSEAIASILNQSFTDFEVIAIDDGSTDHSFSILRQLAKTDSRLKIYKNPQNLNIAHTLNRAIKLARGKYLARMDADDISLADRLEKQITYLKNHPDTVVLGGQCQTINTQGNTIGQKSFPITDREIREQLYNINPIQHPTIMINRKLIPTDFSWYNPNLPPAEDYDLFFRLRKFGRLHNLPDTLLKYRQYLGSSTFHNPVKTFAVTRQVRHLARTQYEYHPSFRALLTHLIQIAIITIVPDFLIYPLYTIYRGIMSPLRLPVLNLNRGQKHHQSQTSLSPASN